MNTLQSQYHAASLIDALHASWTTSVSLSLWFSHTRQDWVSSQLNCCHFSLSNGLRHALIRSNARLTSSRCSFDLTFPPQQLQQRVATHMKTVKSDTWRHGSDLIHSNTKKKTKTLKSGSFSQILHYETTLLEPPMALWKNETKTDWRTGWRRLTQHSQQKHWEFSSLHQDIQRRIWNDGTPFTTLSRIGVQDFSSHRLWCPWPGLESSMNEYIHEDLFILRILVKPLICALCLYSYLALSHGACMFLSCHRLSCWAVLVCIVYSAIALGFDRPRLPGILCHFQPCAPTVYSIKVFHLQAAEEASWGMVATIDTRSLSCDDTSKHHVLQNTCHADRYICVVLNRLLSEFLVVAAANFWDMQRFEIQALQIPLEECQTMIHETDAVGSSCKRSKTDFKK